jgi:hypothetical protein
MPSRYIELRDNIIVEVGSPGETRQEMSGSNIERVDASIETLGDILSRITRPIRASFADMGTALDVPIEVESAEVEVGLSLSAEGGWFVAKVTAEASIGVKVVFVRTKKAG